ncbi:PLP-dependent aminotransferase family protein [Chloroflexia bacterium SDU3-3]|nr:PLP-dependent aminotransferase family protein [Chloroflexia bacterium SDU3-3]
MLTLRENRLTPRYRQLYDALRDAILSGRLAPGSRLPATRTLAQEIGASRNTVVSAFELLLAEGYLETRVGDGTYISRHIPDDLLRSGPPPIESAPAAPGAGALSARGAQIAAIAAAPPLATNAPLAFRPGMPAVDLFPFELWGKLAAKVMRAPSPELLRYGDPAGYAPLREAIASYLSSSRGVACTPQQVIIISGSQQGIDIIGRLLLDPGDVALLEDPGYLGARGALLGLGARVVPVPVGPEGIDIAAARATSPNARLVYVTPSHQYPTGITMSLARRLALIEWARDHSAWILEDDYDSEFRYVGRPLPAMQGLDTHQRTIYIGTFSKMLFPAMRLGYLVVPPHLIGAFSNARALADRGSPSFDQATAAEFLQSGAFARHVRRMRKIYAERQEALVAAADRHLRGLIQIEPSEAGMHLVGWLDESARVAPMVAAAAAQGITLNTIAAYTLGPPTRPGLLFGYAAIPPAEIAAAVRRLAQAWRSLTYRR